MKGCTAVHAAIVECRLSACAARRLPEHVAPGSEAYSPAVHLWVTTDVKNDVVNVRADSGSIVIPGEALPNPPVLARNIYATLLLAVPETLQPVTAGRLGDRRRWRPVAESDSIAITDALRYGERVPVNALRFQLRDTTTALRGDWYLVIRVTGDAIEYSAPVTAGDLPITSVIKGGVRVYSCTAGSTARGRSVKASGTNHQPVGC